MEDQGAAHLALLGYWLFRLVVAGFGALYAAALIWNAIGLTGWFGAATPLSGVYLLVLGLPWTLGAAFFPEHLQPLVAALAPGISFGILLALCRPPVRD